MKTERNPETRPEAITRDFLREVEQHLDDLVTGKVTDMYEIGELAGLLFIHPTHLSTTIKELTGKTPCHFYQEKILETAQRLLATTDQPVREIALTLTYDPSNFTKLFKRYIGVTPKRYRENFRAENPAPHIP